MRVLERGSFESFQRKVFFFEKFQKKSVSRTARKSFSESLQRKDCSFESFQRKAISRASRGRFFRELLKEGFFNGFQRKALRELRELP